MAEEISWERRIDAQDLYVTRGLTFDQVARRTGVSVSQLKRWGQAEGWAGARKEHREAQTSIARDTVKLRAALLSSALGSLDPQKVYAFAAIERAVAAQTGGARDVQPAAPSKKLKDIRTGKDAVEALQEVINLKVNRLLTQPETLELAQIRDMKKCQEMVDQMREKYDPEIPDKQQSLTMERIKELKEQVGL